jgi:hypothetical protein
MAQIFCVFNCTGGLVLSETRRIKGATIPSFTGNICGTDYRILRIFGREGLSGQLPA